MPSPFLSSEEYDERAHQLYNEGNYDDALATLREGLGLYPTATELHVGVGYARVARDDFAWARRRFDDALATLREGLCLYPNATELHGGGGYARVARDECAWARRSFEEARVLDPD